MYDRGGHLALLMIFSASAISGKAQVQSLNIVEGTKLSQKGKLKSSNFYESTKVEVASERSPQL